MAVKLDDLLEGEWLTALSPLITAQPDVERYLGAKRLWTIPKLENTFAALRGHAPQDWKVVILGQDPYPREESAAGIAFNDSAIKNWTDTLNPSFLNIMKSVLAYTTGFDASQDVKALRTAVAHHKLPSPPEWFKKTQEQRVMWLNTSLTFTSKEAVELKRHLAFWSPIIAGIFQTIIEAKKKNISAGTPDGLVVVMWGGFAQKLKAVIQAINAKTSPELPIHFIENNHPAATGPAIKDFHQNNTFASVSAALKTLGLGEINWACADVVAPPPKDTASESTASSSVPADAPAAAAAATSTKRKPPQKAEGAPAPKRTRKAPATKDDAKADEEADKDKAAAAPPAKRARKTAAAAPTPAVPVPVAAAPAPPGPTPPVSSVPVIGSEPTSAVETLAAVAAAAAPATTTASAAAAAAAAAAPLPAGTPPIVVTKKGRPPKKK